MPDHGGRRSSPARLVAPAALLLTLAAIGYVIGTSTGSDGDDGAAAPQSGETQAQGERQQARRRRPFYRVKLNDTLGLIAEKTEVPVERLQELNPELDPQNLVVGQRIRLRE
jgi:LysM repeat protein